MNFYQSPLLIAGTILSFCICIQTATAQQQDTTLHSSSISTKYLEQVSGKAATIEHNLDKKTAKALRQWQKQEARIKQKLAKTDSLKTAAVFSNAKQQYEQLEQKLQSKTSLQQYIPSLDTLGSSLKFLQQNPQLLSNAKGTKEKLSEALAKVNGLETQFQKAEEVKKFLKERKAYLVQQLGQSGFAKEFKNLNKQIYYYNEQVSEYRSLLKDHTKAERKALELLSKSKLFNNFMRKNSILASLFRLPGDPDDPVSTASLTGLQTRAQINGIIQQQIAAGGPNSQQQFSQNLQAAQSQLNELKNKVNQLSSGSSDMEMPEGFKVNSQKVKNFWQKWEIGANVQSNRASGIMPVSSDLGISAGFKPNNWFISGIGFAGRIGWGKNIRHISVTYSGISARSFVEVKLKSKGSFHAIAAYEMNYRPEIRTIEQLKDKSGWQPSLLAGLSKVISLKTKFFKKTKLQLMLDMLSYRQVPRTKPVVFRVGYIF